MKYIERNTLLGLALLAALFPVVVSNQYALHVGIMVLFYAALASSLNLIVGYVGEVSLGHGAFLGLGAYTSALLSLYFQLPMWLTIPCAGIVSAFFGFAIGAVTLRVHGPYFVIITLAFSEILLIVAKTWVDLTNGPMGIAGIAQPELIVNASPLVAKQIYFYLALTIAALVLYLCFRFVYSNNGRAVVTIRENINVSQSVGIRPFVYAMRAFVLGAFMAGLAGGFYAHYFTFVGPGVFGFSFMATMLIMVLIGGRGTLLGPLVGALLVTALTEYLREFPEARLSLIGLIVMVVVLFLPNGLVSFLNHHRQRRGGRGKNESRIKSREGVL